MPQKVVVLSAARSDHRLGATVSAEAIKGSGVDASLLESLTCDKLHPN